MTIEVLLFAAAKSSAGCSAVAVELPEPACVADVKSALERRFPALRPLLQRSAIAVNQQIVAGDFAVRRGDEIAWIPPVSGG
jgi:molybdopterin converting factor subunit 1